MAEGVGSFIGNSVGEAAAFAAGLAIGPILSPLLRELENITWSEYPDKPMDALSAARGAAEGKWDQGTGQAEALNTGFGKSVFPMMVELFKTAPSLAQAFDLIRRGQMPPDQLPTVIKRLALEDQWTAFYTALSATDLHPWETPLSPADLAVGLVRGNLDPNTIGGADAFPLGGPVANSTVPPDPVSELNVEAEAAASGYSLERMQILARNVGLPPGVIEGLRLWNRGDINEDAVNLLIAQSDLRLSWTDAIKKLAREILTPHEYVEARLRAWIKTDEEMYAGTAMSGLNEADTRLLYLITGRPIAPHRVFIGGRRGGTYNGPTDGIDADFLKAQQESNERPEWYNLDWATRFTKPTLFFVRTWLKDGHDPAQAHTWLYELGYEESDIALIIQAYTPAAGTGGSKKFTVGEIKAAWKAGQLDPDQTRARLEALGYSAADANILITTWAFVPPPTTAIA